MKYPKINSLYKRLYTDTDPITGKVTYLNKGKEGNPLIIGEYACPEFVSIKYWSVTEKVDGTNIRITFQRDDTLAGPKCSVSFDGRTDNANIPAPLFKYLTQTFTPEKMGLVFGTADKVVLFGEGYGGKIQSGGYYRQDVSFRLFDAFIDGWWLDVEKMMALAVELNVDHVPLLLQKYSKYTSEGDKQVTTFLWTTEDIWDYVSSGPKSTIANVQEHNMEGIVARSAPMMLFRERPVICDEPLTFADYHVPIMFKLKYKDTLYAS